MYKGSQKRTVGDIIKAHQNSNKNEHEIWSKKDLEKKKIDKKNELWQKKKKYCNREKKSKNKTGKKFFPSISLNMTFESEFLGQTTETFFLYTFL